MLIAPNQPQPLRRNSQWGTFLPALAAGLAAAGLAFLLVRSHLPVEAAAPARVLVVVAAHDIPARTRLTAALLQTRSLSQGDVPEDAVRTRAEIIGKVSLQLIPAGAAVTQNAVTAPSAALGMAFALPPSLRAVTVATDPADGVDLFVRPEDHVDILATDEPGSGPAEARTVLQNVLLLAVGNQTSPDPPSVFSSAPASGASHVTVAVSPSQAQALVLAAARGHLHLALRAIGDGGEAPLPAAFPEVMPADPEPVPRHALSQPHIPHQAGRFSALPLTLLPLSPLPASPPGRVTVTIIKGTASQTISVAP